MWRTYPNPGAFGRVFGTLSGMILGPAVEGVCGVFFGLCYTLFCCLMMPIVGGLIISIHDPMFIYNSWPGLHSIVDNSITFFVEWLICCVKAFASVGVFLGLIDGIIAGFYGETVFLHLGAFWGWVCDSAMEGYS